MTTFTNKQLMDILAKHQKWINGGEGGKQANLRYANLQNADLRGAILRNADLRDANLQKTILENMNWLAYIGIIPDRRGKARAYKMITQNGLGPQYPVINYLKKRVVAAPNLDKDTDNPWCQENKFESSRLLLMEFDTVPDNICVPTASDGKFRVKEAVRIGECGWNGDLIKSEQG